jgi:hypothetical protein
MKKTVTLIFLGFILNAVIAQNTDSVFVQIEKDEMSNKTYVYPNRTFVVANESSTKGFKVDVFIKENLTISSVMTIMVGLGGCNENDEIIILFENGEKITKRSWKKFNCDGESYFDLTNSELQMLRTLPLSKIRLTNGRTFDSYTGDVKEKDKRYFIQLLYALDNKLVQQVK